jgi:entry exclusion lipoprotein TrbK
MNVKYLKIAIVALLSACSQEPQDTEKPTDSLINGVNPVTPLNSIPEVNDANCKFEYMKSISDKFIQQTLADNCARRNTLKPTEHKPWTLR